MPKGIPHMLLQKADNYGFLASAAIVAQAIVAAAAAEEEQQDNPPAGIIVVAAAASVVVAAAEQQDNDPEPVSAASHPLLKVLEQLFSHPQFVAAKSLIYKVLRIGFYTVSYAKTNYV